jgi:ATP-dependent DNA ligase
MTFGVSPPPDAAVANPWLRINRVLRVILHTPWSTAAWAEVRVEFRKALAPDGLEAWKQVIERGYEGYVAKDERSPYEGGATRRWLKVKQKGWTVEEDRWRRRIFGEDRR